MTEWLHATQKSASQHISTLNTERDIIWNLSFESSISYNYHYSKSCRIFIEARDHRKSCIVDREYLNLLRIYLNSETGCAITKFCQLLERAWNQKAGLRDLWVWQVKLLLKSLLALKKAATLWFDKQPTSLFIPYF